MMPDQMDKVTKEMLANSVTEWDDPDFNTATMNKIVLEADRRTRRRLFLSLFYFVAAIVLFGFFLFRILNAAILIPDPTSLQNGPFHSVLTGIWEIADWVIENEYFILPLLLLLLIKKIIDSRLKYN